VSAKKFTFHELYKYTRINDKRIDKAKIDGYPNFWYITRPDGAETSVQLESGINPKRSIKAPDGERFPVILISSSEHKYGSLSTPWQDVFDTDNGYIRYFGDNKNNTHPPEKKSGNKACLRQFNEFYESKDEHIRKLAAPMLFFRSTKKGIREFLGFGIIEQVSLVTQRDPKSGNTFSNYVYDCAVFNLKMENEHLYWEWIHKRCDKSCTIDETHELAPQSWKDWCKTGKLSLPKVRRKVGFDEIAKKEDQLPVKNSKYDKILKQIYSFYSQTPAKKKRFEMLAAKVSEFILNESGAYEFGWLTQGGGDGGADFYGVLKHGRKFGSAKQIVLGQAKCEKLNTATNGNHIARTVARLKRGWLGVYVTTSYFSKDVQKEIIEDAFPLLLVNGLKVAEVVDQAAYLRGIDVENFLQEVDSEYEKSISNQLPKELLLD